MLGMFEISSFPNIPITLFLQLKFLMYLHNIQIFKVPPTILLPVLELHITNKYWNNYMSLNMTSKMYLLEVSNKHF